MTKSATGITSTPTSARAYDSDGIHAFTKADLGRRLHRLLYAKGISPAEFARRLGVNRQRISAYTTGRSFPKPAMLMAMAKVLGVEPEDIHPRAGVVTPSEARVIDFQTAPGDPNRMIVRLNVVLPTPVAVKIMTLVNAKHAD